MTDPWGWKVSIWIYGEGERPLNVEVLRAVEAAYKILGADGFAGSRVGVVVEEPGDQVAS